MDLQNLKNEKKVVGTKQTARALKEDKVTVVFVAKDAEKHVTKNVEELSKEKGIEVIYVNSMKELGRACNIQVRAAVAGILK
ncbi:ribosomal L7Ae/L30e/S12e/Gadd45 family protein [Tepidibacter formicigenes]|jgi:large subunit ribosomal protein L7A|uniref:Large subunit ribosomal protein L7A n=1 Tax=Tepidibacter formicigenes DSM 15518 TaxID=1123349 RepID=A0A1M6RSN6_9FIRM|nr:ribosomal L7Ae/L30e/S12e/Gadd45 family protein [Tepidibacter formicigenes]SHK35277.1 large subunit ribosomal protein L7A [Tepidibacter formicigenes DSM 15518]